MKKSIFLLVFLSFAGIASPYSNEPHFLEEEGTYEPQTQFVFYEKGEVGRIDWSTGVLRFSGNISHSARMLFETAFQPTRDTCRGFFQQGETLFISRERSPEKPEVVLSDDGDQWIIKPKNSQGKASSESRVTGNGK